MEFRVLVRMCENQRRSLHEQRVHPVSNGDQVDGLLSYEMEKKMTCIIAHGSG